MKRIVSISLLSLAAMACDAITPQLSIKVKAIPPCNQPDALEDVSLMQIRSVDAKGMEKSTQASKGSKAATLAGLNIADGTTVFVNGFEDASALEEDPEAAGASVPLNLQTFTTENAFPGARQYPPNGTILIPTGKVYSFGNTTDPSKSGTVSEQCSTLAQGRHGHTATFLPTIGKVLILGGLTYSSDGAETFVPRDRAVEYYDPITGKYETVSLDANVAPLMQRAFHTATLLPDGNVLIWAGVGPEGSAGAVTPRAVSFVYRPDFDGEGRVRQLVANNGFQHKRFHHQATLTRSGNSVVITGGCGCVGSLTPEQVKGGQCPKAGEVCQDGSPRVSFVDVFDTTSGAIRTLNTALAEPRAFHTASALEGELVVIAGGDNGNDVASGVELYGRLPGGNTGILSPVTDQLGTAKVTRAAAVVLGEDDCRLLLPTHLANECVLITGGCRRPIDENGVCPDDNQANSSLQLTSTIIDFGEPAGQRVKPDGPALSRGRFGHEAVYMPKGTSMVVVAGGYVETPVTDSLPVSAEAVDRTAQTGFSALRYLMTAPRARFATAYFPSGQPMFVGGVPMEQPATPESLSSSELFFFPFE